MTIRISAFDVLNSTQNFNGSKVFQYMVEVFDSETMFYIEEASLKKHAFEVLCKNLLMTEEIVYINPDRQKFIESQQAANLDSEASIIKNSMLTQQDLDDITNFFDSLDKALTPRVGDKLKVVKEGLNSDSHFKFVQHIKDKYTLAISTTEDNVTNSDFTTAPADFGFSLVTRAPFELNYAKINLFHKKLFVGNLSIISGSTYNKHAEAGSALAVDKNLFSNQSVYDAMVAIRENVDAWIEEVKKVATTVNDRSNEFNISDPFQSLFNGL